MSQEIKKVFIEELLKKIVSIENFGSILMVLKHVDVILRAENKINIEEKHSKMMDTMVFKIKATEDIREPYFFREESSFRDLEYGKKKRRFGKCKL